MRLLPILIASAAAVSAQSPLTTTFASNNGQSGNMFDVVATNAAGVTIKSFEVNIDAGVWDLEVWTLPSGTPYLPDVNNAGAWTLLASASGVTGAGLNLPTLLPICVDTFVPTATTQAFYVTVTNGTSMNYTNGTTTGALYASNADLEFYEGSGLAYPFNANFNPRVWNGTISYDIGNTSGSGCGFATTESIGDGCVSDLASVYELTTLDAFALTNTMTGIDYINTGGGYLLTTAAGTMHPVGTVDPATVPVAGVGDDAAVAVGTLGLEFGSNGWLALGTGNSPGFIPTPAVFLDNPAAQFSFWSDFQPNTGGDINYEEAGTRALLTYTDVLAWGTSDLNTFQFDYDSATGNCSMYLGALASATAHPTMIGYSPAGPNGDPGSIGLEAELLLNGAIILAAADTIPLALEGIGRPVMGAAPTPYQATTSNIDAGALFHAGLLGLTNPSTPLSIIGFPAGCTLYSSADVLVGPDVVAGGPGSLTWTVLGLPIANAAFNGVELYVAAATLDLSLISATSRSSNGIKLTLGDS
jgi:hypothetical protein